ncbi:MAG: hypothetical protein HQ525_02800 [Anaerolineae bacterium]|nr:hypothetical protein [Anaerolineae bacterium]
MNMLKKYSFVTMILVAAFLLSACFPAETTEGSTINATQAAELIETAVAQALNAQATQIAASVPQATATPIPTNTPAPALPTHTLVPTITPLVLAPTAAASGGGGGGGGGGGTVVTYPNACDPDLGKRPFDNSEYKPGDPFDIKFTIENTGTATWPAGYDLVHFSGPDMTNAGYTTESLPEMKPGARHSVGPFDATAPAEKGFTVMTFKLQGGFCWPYVAIKVK